jgi:hypothetical protein
VSAKREDKHQDKRAPDTRKGRRLAAGRRDRNDSSERPAPRAGGQAASSKPTKDRTTECTFQKTRQERWQKPPRAQKTSASGIPNVNSDRAQRLTPPSRKFEEEDRRTGGNPEGRARGRDQAQKRSNGPRSPRPYEKPGGGRPAGGAKPPSGGGPRGRGGSPKGRPRGKS